MSSGEIRRTLIKNKDGEEKKEIAEYHPKENEMS